MTDKQQIAGSLFWKLLERGGVQVTQFIVSIIIARLLLPSAYGAVAILMIFISIATVFVQSGLNTALIQKKDVDNSDISSVLFYCLGIATISYLIIYFSSPYIASFFNIDELTVLLRVTAITLYPGAVNAIQLAILSKRMQFKKQFYAGLAASIISGVVGIVMAYRGFEAWALVGQQLTSQIVICILLSFMAKWNLTFNVSFSRTKPLLAYGSKLLGARLIDTLYHNLESIIIGKEFSAATLAYCNKGKQFPLTLIDNIDGSIQSVMLPAYSAKQENVNTVKGMLRRTLSLTTFIVFPLMIILAATANSVIYLLLGPNWHDAVPYLQLFCFIAMMFPLQTADLQAINAMGRSDVYFKLISWKRLVGVIFLLTSVMIWKSPFAVVIAALIVEIFAIIINAPANKKILGYTFGEMMSDILPNAALSLVVGVFCWSLTLVINNHWILLPSQIFWGIIMTMILSMILRRSQLAYIMELLHVPGKYLHFVTRQK